MTTKINAAERTRRGFIAAAGKHSVEAAAATERMMTTARLGGIAIDPGLVESVRQFFAEMGAAIDREAERII